MIIGATIKKLRRERDITQEQLAEYLNISSQAISQWECDRCAPDISQLPLLANIFEVSADILLGIDVDSKEKRIKEIHNEAYDNSCKGFHVKAIEEASAGLAEYPDSYKLMNFLASELYTYYVVNLCEAEAERNSKHREIAALYDKIIAGCTDNDIRTDAIAGACLIFPDIGRYDDAVKLAESMSVYTKQELLEFVYTGTKKVEQLRKNIKQYFQGAMINADTLVKRKNDDGTPAYSEDEVLRIHEKIITMYETFFEDGDYLFDSQSIELSRMDMARIYARRGDAENTLVNLGLAAKYAVMFDTYDPKAKHTSLLVRGFEAGGIMKTNTSNNSYNMLRDISDKKYDFVRSDMRYTAIEAELKKYTKE